MSYSRQTQLSITISILVLLGLYTHTHYSTSLESTTSLSPIPELENSRAQEIPTDYPKVQRVVEPEMEAISVTHNFHKLRDAMRRDANEFIIKKNADGSEKIRMNGAFHTVSAARRLPDGTLLVGCFESFAAIEDFLTSSSPPAPSLASDADLE